MTVIPQQRYALPEHEFLDTYEAAAWLGCSAKTLERWRSIPFGPAWFPMKGKVKYSRQALTEFVDSCMAESPAYNPERSPIHQAANRPKRNRSGRRISDRKVA